MFGYCKFEIGFGEGDNMQSLREASQDAERRGNLIRSLRHCIPRDDFTWNLELLRITNSHMSN